MTSTHTYGQSARHIDARAAARAMGYKRFFTGEPCRNEHVAERYVSNNECVKCRQPSLRADRHRKEKHWPDDGGAKRVAVYDHTFTPKRLVRLVGWVNCLTRRKSHRFLSPDVRRIRTCDSCKLAAELAMAHHAFD